MADCDPFCVYFSKVIDCGRYILLLTAAKTAIPRGGPLENTGGGGQLKKIVQSKGFVQKGRISDFGSIFIFCRIELIFGRLTCFDMKRIVP